MGVGLRTAARRLASRWQFSSSESYWQERYAGGGNSGLGSYGHLATFKADFLNQFVERRGVETVLEFGCGDGNQLALARYPEYIGLDVAPMAIELCSDRFNADGSKSFLLYSPGHFVNRGALTADLALSLDVIFHLVEDSVYHTYMRDLFNAARRFVIIYSSNDDRNDPAQHVRHRRFTTWVEKNEPSWRLCEKVKNPHAGNDPAAVANFYVYER